MAKILLLVDEISLLQTEDIKRRKLVRFLLFVLITSSVCCFHASEKS